MTIDIIRESPYVGLIPFSEEDAPLFFGREHERDLVTFSLLGSRLTLLYGATGSGKSSLLRAGVAHHLREHSRQNLLSHGTPEFIAVVFNNWSGNPLPALSVAIEQSVRAVLGNRIPEGIQIPNSLVETIRLASEIANSDLLIILDQFEEYFLYHGHDRGDFYSEFSRAVNHPDLRVSFLISIRADALSSLDLFKEHIPNLFANYMRLRHLDYAGAHEAIKKPLEVFNVRHGAYQAFTIEDELVEEVCRQVQAEKILIGETGYGAVEAKENKGQVETSFLQLVMTKLWEAEFNRGSRHLRLSTLKHLGNAVNIVRSHLNDHLQALPSEEQEVAAAVFRYLVTPGGTKIAFTVSDLASLTESDLVGSAEERQESISRVLEKLSHTTVRVLRPFYRDKREQSEKSYEIFHDVLAPAILDWRARYLTEREKARVARQMKEREEKERAHLEEEAQRRIIEEERRRRREERKAKQLSRILIVSATITIIFSFLAYYAQRQMERALTATQEAEKSRAEANKRLDIIKALDKSVPYFQAVMRGHEKAVVRVNFSPNGERIITASTDGTARIWDATTGDRIAILDGHEGEVNSADFSPDGRLVVTTSGRAASVWNAADATQPLRTLAGHTGEVNDAQFSPDGRLVVTSSDDATAHVWEAETGRQVCELRGHLGAVTSAMFSPDSQFVVTSSIDSTARIWDARTGSATAILEGHKSVVNTAAFNPSGDLIVTASSDHDARIWNAATGQVVAALRGHAGSVDNAEFSPDGTLIVTSSNDKTARVWDAKSRRMVGDLKGHKAEVVSAKFSPDSTRVITASADGTALVWESVSGKLLFELRGHTNVVNHAVFSPAGESAATVSEDTTARIWDIAGAGGVRVTDLSLQAEPDRYAGPCPVSVRLIGTINAIGSGTVKYRFVRNNIKNGTGPERSIEFFNSGSKEVSSTWIFGGSRYPNPSGSFHIEITSPQAMQSEEAAYNIRCQLPAPEPITPDVP